MHVVEWAMLETPSHRHGQTIAGASGAWPVLHDPGLSFVTPQLRRMLEVWRAKRNGRTMPARADLGLRDLTFVLPHVAFLAIVHEEARVRFRVRLMGSELDAYVGPMTGQFIDEAVPRKFAEKWSEPWAQVVETRQPMRSVARVEFRERNYYISESLCAPLAVDGEHPDGLMLGVYYHVSDGDPATQSEIASRLVGDLGGAT